MTVTSNTRSRKEAKPSFTRWAPVSVSARPQVAQLQDLSREKESAMLWEICYDEELELLLLLLSLLLLSSVDKEETEEAGISSSPPEATPSSSESS